MTQHPRPSRRRGGPLLLLALALVSCGDDRPVVVVYTSVDAPYSRPILEAFEARSGIRVQARYDTEADKTAGLFHKLIEEAARPRADVFWSSEALFTVRLAERGLLAPYASPVAAELPASCRGRGDAWTAFGARVRVLIYNVDRVRPEDAPRSIADLAAPRWRGRATMALPLFGTTATHAGALWARLGGERAEALFRAMAANDVLIANGNAHVRDLVVSGAADIGITDTDDAHEALRRGLPVRMVFPDQSPGALEGVDGALGAFAIPNTVACVRGGPHRETAERLVDFLLSAEVETRLAASGAAQIPLRPGVPPPAALGVPADLVLLEADWEAAARGLEAALPVLREIFQR